MSIDTNTLADFLVTAPLFRALDRAEMAEVLGILEVVELPAGYQIFDEGDPAGLGVTHPPRVSTRP